MITRRSFAVALATGLAGLALAAPVLADEGASRLKFEIYEDKGGEFRWRLAGGNGEPLATSGEGYKAKAAAKNGIERIKSDADKLAFETYTDAKNEFRWRVKAKNGQIIGTSSEGYKAKAGAERAITIVKEGAKDAAVEDKTDAKK